MFKKETLKAEREMMEGWKDGRMEIRKTVKVVGSIQREEGFIALTKIL
jgi:hypothetical protein